jgi:hypothetical protein
MLKLKFKPYRKPFFTKRFSFSCFNDDPIDFIMESSLHLSIEEGGSIFFVDSLESTFKDFMKEKGCSCISMKSTILESMQWISPISIFLLSILIFPTSAQAKTFTYSNKGSETITLEVEEDLREIISVLKTTGGKSFVTEILEKADINRILATIDILLQYIKSGKKQPIQSIQGLNEIIDILFFLMIAKIGVDKTQKIIKELLNIKGGNLKGGENLSIPEPPSDEERDRLEEEIKKRIEKEQQNELEKWKNTPFLKRLQYLIQVYGKVIRDFIETYEIDTILTILVILAPFVACFILWNYLYLLRGGYLRITY